MRERLFGRFREISDFDLLKRQGLYLSNLIGQRSFKQLKEELSTAEPTTVDIGAGNNVLTGVIFFNAMRTVCVDPAYAWYDCAKENLDQHLPSGVFGGIWHKDKMISNLRLAFKDLQLPQRIEGYNPKVIEGKRGKLKRTIELYPDDAAVWIRQQHANSLPNIVMWRVFTSAENWGLVISSLKTGGFLLTTGIGESKFGEILEAEDKDKFSGGGDVDNTPIPRNGKSELIGLRPIADPPIYFYQKVQHFPEEEIAKTIIKYS